MNDKNLIVYYSRSGNTKAAAETIRSLTGGQMRQIETVREYPAGYTETTQIARTELKQDARPEIRETGINVDDFDTVFIGYPNWWNTMPMALFTFLEQHDLSGKTILPFCTHGGGGAGRGEQDILQLCPGATVLNTLSIHGGLASDARPVIIDWLNRSGITTNE